jgi:stage II sporulation protein AA (anti-sigma F factor antagonist)
MGTPLETVRALWAAYEEGGVDAMLRVAGDDVVWQPDLGHGRIARGAAELRAAVEELAREGIEATARLLDLEAHDGAVLAHGVLVVRRPSGVEELDRHWLLHFRGGRLARQTVYASRDDALDALAALRAVAAAPLLIGEERDAGVQVVRVGGELDIATAPRLASALLRHRAAGERLVVDLSSLQFMDSTGLRVLLRARRAADEGGWQICLRDVPPTIERLFSLAGVKDVLPIEAPRDGQAPPAPPEAEPESPL